MATGDQGLYQLKKKMDEIFPYDEEEMAKAEKEMADYLKTLSATEAAKKRRQNAEVTELAKLKFSKEDDDSDGGHFEGIKMNGEKNTFQKINHIDHNWVRKHFNPLFVQLCETKDNMWHEIPLGKAMNIDDGQPPSKLSTLVATKYQQGREEYCLVYSLISAIHYCGLDYSCDPIKVHAERISKMAQLGALQEICLLMRTFCPLIGKATKFNMRIKGKKVRREITIEELVSSRCAYPTLVVPLGRDGSINHAFCVVDDLIFDSTCRNALKLTTESFNWICGRQGCAGIHRAIRFQGKEGVPGVPIPKDKNFNREPRVNWHE